MRLWLWLLAITLAATACAPAQNSPPPPRLAEPTSTLGLVATTTTTAPTTTTTQPVELCPGAMCLRYHIRPDAAWSDGAPVTASDLAFTAEFMRDSTSPDPGMASVASVEVVDEKTAVVVLDRPLASWPDLFARVVRSDLGAGPPQTVTGPFALSEWVPGDRIVLQRVLPTRAVPDPVTGSPMGSVSTLRFVFADSPEAMIDSLLRGEVDVVFTRPTEDSVRRLEGREGEVRFDIAEGPFWEHIALDTNHPLLAQPWLRRAIAMAIDRESILDATVRQIDLESRALGNTVQMRNSPSYVDNFPYRYDPAAAEELLVDNFCTREQGEPYTCQGRTLSFVWTATDDDPARRSAFEIAADNLASIGIELTPSFQPPSRFVTRDYLFGDRSWQLINFSWRATGDPTDTVATYACNGDLNVTRLCDPELDGLAAQAAATPDLDERDDLFNRVDQTYLDSAAVIPLYQKPTLVAWNAEVQGPAANFSPATDLWNVASWTGPDQVIIAMLDEPGDLDPSDFSDEAANLVLAPLLYGAFSMTPELEYVPVLVESVEVVEGK